MSTSPDTLAPVFAPATSVSDAVFSRRSVRAFHPDPVPLALLRAVLDKARFAPSGCNYQPWEAHVLTGAPLAALQDKMKAATPQDPPEYRWDAPSESDRHKGRLHEVGAAMYAAMSIDRGDRAARGDFAAQNVISFGAPVLMLIHFPRLMGPPQWSDVGMWLQTVMLLLREAGLDSCPQEYLWAFARLIKEHIGVSDAEQIFFCGLAIGYRDAEDPVNQWERPRIPLDEQVRFLGFD